MSQRVRWSPEQYDAYLRKTGETVVSTPREPKKKLLRRRRVMNKTEAEFARILEARQKRGEIVSFDFEGVALRFGNNETFIYSPDFVVTKSHHTTTDGIAVHYVMIEVKGAHIRQKDWDRFKHARDNYPLLTFQLWQKKAGAWSQLA